MFCANAGIARGGSTEQASEQDWNDSWQVNVMAHVRAARLLFPAWLERGSGHLICTVSAAGLLTMLGSAPYSVTKHAALGFAEWLAVNLRHRGITVQAICPRGADPRMLAWVTRPEKLILADSAITPEAVADAVMAGDRGRAVPDPASPGGGPDVRGPCQRPRPLAGGHEQAPAEGRGGVLSPGRTGLTPKPHRPDS